MIRELARQRTTMILVTHEIAFAKEAADKVLYMDQGEIVEYGNARTVIDTPSKERTKAFLERYY